jgi:hypothetical protein
MFVWRTSYKKVIENFALEAMTVDPMQAPGLVNAPEELGGYTYNALEGVAAILFLSQVALRVLGDSDKFDKARDYLATVFIEALDEQYSKKEMHSLVVPLLERRHIEYTAILDGIGEPGDRTFQLCSAMISRFVQGHVDVNRKGLATIFLLNKLMLEPGKKFKAMSDAGKIKW